MRQWRIDAFSGRAGEGNPAAVVPLARFPDAEAMQRLATRNNLSETAYFVETGPGRYALRWFTPAAEVDLCGHATLASGWLLLEELAPNLKAVTFDTRSGALTVARGADGLHRMSLPADPVAAFAAPDGFEEELGGALGVPPPREVHLGRYLLALWEDAGAVRAIAPGRDLPHVLRGAGHWGLIATARSDRGSGYDFVSRFFAPDKGVPEDPVTGSAHCALAPFWARRLDRTELRARQVSPRGGDVLCWVADERVVLSGPCRIDAVEEVAF